MHFAPICFQMQHQSLARSFQVVSRIQKLFRCEVCRRTLIGAFGDRLDFFWKKLFGQFVLFGSPWLQSSKAQIEFQENLERPIFTGTKEHIVTGFIQRKLTYWDNSYYLSMLVVIICKDPAFLEKSEYRRGKKSKILSFNFLDPAKCVSFDLGCKN